MRSEDLMKSPWSVPNDDIALSHYQGGIQIPGFEYTSISNWLDLNVSQTKTLIWFPHCFEAQGYL